MKYLDLKTYIWLLGPISVIFYLLLILIFPLTSKTFITYLNPIPKVVTLDTFVIFLFNKWIWKCKLLHDWLVPFPNLNGTWKGSIQSDWIDPKTGKKPDSIPAILTIKQSFPNISCVMRTKEMTSRNFISDFEIDKENQILRLIYSYVSEPDPMIKHRSAQHKGTILFDIIKDNGEIKLSGTYWTDRKTTGKIELNFYNKERLEKYPDELGEHPVSRLRSNPKT